MKKIFLLAWSTLLSVCVNAAELTVMEQGSLVKDGFHNAFPSIAAYKGKLYMAHRKATGHRRYDGVTALYESTDNGKTFQKVREFTGNGDMRDPRLCIVEGKLVIYNGCGHPQKNAPHKYSLKAFRSSDGKNFEEFTVKGLAEDSFFWGCVPFENGYIATSYKRVGNILQSSLYYSTDGANFKPYLTFPGSGNETSLCPGKDGNLYCIVRREGGDCRPVYYVVKEQKIVKSVKLSEPLQGIMLTANGENFIVGSEGQRLHQRTAVGFADALAFDCGHQFSTRNQNREHLTGSHNDGSIHLAGVPNQIGAGQEGTHGVSQQEVREVGKTFLC